MNAERAARLRKAASIAVLVVLGGVLAASVPYHVPQVVGADEAYVVRSGSMEPAYEVGDVVFVERVDPETVQVGDVVTFRTRSVLVTHRVVEVRDGPAFVVKGDANHHPDPVPVGADALVGVVVGEMPHYGKLALFAKSRLGAVLLFVVPGVAILVTEGRRFLRPREDAR